MNIRYAAPLVSLAMAATTLTGCSYMILVTHSDGNSDEVKASMADKTSCNLRACIDDADVPYALELERTGLWKEIGAYFKTVRATAQPDPSRCDVVIHIETREGNKVSIDSAFTGKRILRMDGVTSRSTANATCKLLEDGKPDFLAIPGSAVEAYRKDGTIVMRPPRVPARVTSVPAVAPQAAPAITPPSAAPSNAVSREELAQMIASMKSNQAPAPAPEREASLPASPLPSFSAPERANDLAVIVGIETYSDISSKANYAERDADAFKAHVRALGVPERNIVLLKGSKAGRASLVKNVELWLPRLAKADSRVYFYFSGHGAPDVKTGQAYLVPWDGDPNFLEATAYPVATLYKKLSELPAKQVLVAMDSCFSGAGGRSVLASGARPLVGKIETGAVPAKITVLAASANNEISGSLDDKGHGAFTYFLLQGLDAGKTTPKQLSDYLTPRVQDEAKRLNRDQTPQIQGDGGWSLR